MDSIKEIDKLTYAIANKEKTIKELKEEVYRTKETIETLLAHINVLQIKAYEKA